MRGSTSQLSSCVRISARQSFRPLLYPPIILLSFLLFSCSEGLPLPESKATDSVGFEERELEWCIMVYMAADNELEVQALCDINEMEAGYGPGTGIKIVCLDPQV